eukprot:g6121.t1
MEMSSAVAVVTGGGSGIGAGISEALARSKYSLVLGYRSNRERCETWAQHLRDAHGVKVVCVGGDLAEQAAFDALFAAVDSEFDGQLVAAVHNAGQHRGGDAGAAFGTGTLLDGGAVDFSGFDFYSSIYAKGFCALAERAAARMADGAGYIVGITSPGCSHMTTPRAHYDLPMVGKCVMEQMARYYAKALAPRRICCNCVMPGLTDTPAWQQLGGGGGGGGGNAGGEKLVARLAEQRCPMKVALQPADIGNAVAFLCSERASNNNVIPAAHGLVYAGAAASLAVVITNPADTIKTRMQLQGELVRRGVGASHYKGTLDCFLQTARVEGMRGLQRGLVTAVNREFLLNGVRVGLYDPVLRALHSRSAATVDAPPGLPTKFAAGLITGCCGALTTNPLDLLKVRMQAEASGANAAVGHQHGYKGILHGLSSMVGAEGYKGMYKGVSASMLRLALGSAAQLSAYSTLKEQVAAHRQRLAGRGECGQWWIADGPALHVVLSFGSVLFGVTAMQPVDVVRTRLYNQPFDGAGRGTLYAGPLDAFGKVVRNEGALALFKGWGAHYLRGAPHVALLFVTLEQLKKHRPLERGGLL